MPDFWTPRLRSSVCYSKHTILVWNWSPLVQTVIKTQWCLAYLYSFCLFWTVRPASYIILQDKLYRDALEGSGGYRRPHGEQKSKKKDIKHFQGSVYTWHEKFCIYWQYPLKIRHSITAKIIFGPRQANSVLIAYASSEGSGEPAHPRSLARTFAARSYKQWVKRNI